MFDIGFFELIAIALVFLLITPPKDVAPRLKKLLRFIKNLRQRANFFWWETERKLESSEDDPPSKDP